MAQVRRSGRPFEAADRRLADEYDKAQEMGEVRRPNNEKTNSCVEAVSASDIGITYKEIHEARKIRDAERELPASLKAARFTPRQNKSQPPLARRMAFSYIPFEA
ncbi:hypothetical protein ACQKP1_07695 [Allorhizobium sp. NPDC080224]|uniref:hypothetical protein n=1 Tax=Allorhizobium sp. NPDC080224 TaxID=3390547 RepID=UPI003CFEFAB0